MSSEPIPDLAHDPAKCATCSGRRHRPEPNPIADDLEELLERLSSTAENEQPEAP